MNIREATPEDYDALYALWLATPGMGLSAADSRGSIISFLARNPGLNFVCEEGGALVGCCMCGSDGRRGYIYHTAVLPAYRGRGWGGELVRRCLQGLADAGIDKCHVFVFADNAVGNAFWAAGWQKREDILVYSHIT